MTSGIPAGNMMNLYMAMRVYEWASIVRCAECAMNNALGPSSGNGRR